ncbi:MAG: hypothetical protein M1832_004346 [Thelocarpon impressellum]|nr:MAG: hypothetical protein M1832_004346 [Thelocarpon impressellum]
MRSPADATRFTATGPHAYSNTSPPTSSSHPQSAGRPNPPETSEAARAKVLRLKQAAAQARLSQVSSVDRVVVAGRVWADRAHRFVALSLIGATAVCGIYATVALGDMVLYNRRKRGEFFAAQKALYGTHVAEARAAVAAGTANEQQAQLAAHEDTLTKALPVEEGKGVLARGRAWLFGGLKTEDEGAEPLVSGVETGGVLDAVKEARLADSATAARETPPADALAVREGVREGVRGVREGVREGGPLDRLGTPSSPSPASSSTAGGILSWIPGRSSSPPSAPSPSSSER